MVMQRQIEAYRKGDKVSKRNTNKRRLASICDQAQMTTLFAEHFLKGCFLKFAFEDSSSQGKERKQYVQLQSPVGQCFALGVDNFPTGTLGLHLLGVKKIQ